MIEAILAAAFAGTVFGMLLAFWIERTRGRDLERSARIAGIYATGLTDGQIKKVDTSVNL